MHAAILTRTARYGKDPVHVRARGERIRAGPPSSIAYDASMGRRRSHYALPLLGGLAACGISVVGVGADAPTDALDASARDGAPSGDAEASDAGSTPDVAVNDASTVDGATASDGGDAGTSYCDTLTPPASLCADFDDGDFSAGWDSTAADAGTTLSSSAAFSTSSPRSLHAISTQGKPAALRKTLTVTTSLSVDYDVRFVTSSTTGDVSSVLLTPPTFPGYDVYFFVGGTKSYFQEYGDDYSPMLAAPSPDVWHHVHIALALGASTAINASLDGTTYWSSHALLHTWPTPVQATIQIGVASLYQETNGEVFIDNVVVRAQ